MRITGKVDSGGRNLRGLLRLADDIIRNGTGRKRRIPRKWRTLEYDQELGPGEARSALQANKAPKTGSPIGGNGLERKRP